MNQRQRKKPSQKLNAPPQQPAAPPPKIVTRSLVDMAVEAQLEGPELQAFVEQQKKAFDELQVLNVKKNLAQCTLITAELNAFLSVFDQWAAADKAELARSLLNHSAHTGNLTQQQLEVFALKLARMGIHQ